MAVLHTTSPRTFQRSQDDVNCIKTDVKGGFIQIHFLSVVCYEIPFPLTKYLEISVPNFKKIPIPSDERHKNPNSQHRKFANPSSHFFTLQDPLKINQEPRGWGGVCDFSQMCSQNEGNAVSEIQVSEMFRGRVSPRSRLQMRTIELLYSIECAPL